MLNPPCPPGDGRTYCEGMFQEIARYIFQHIVRAERKGQACFIASRVAARDLGMSTSTWYRYTRYMERSELLRRSGRRGRYSRDPMNRRANHENPGARYHFISRKCLNRAIFFELQKSESRINLSLIESNDGSAVVRPGLARGPRKRPPVTAPRPHTTGRICEYHSDLYVCDLCRGK